MKMDEVNVTASRAAEALNHAMQKAVSIENAVHIHRASLVQLHFIGSMLAGLMERLDHMRDIADEHLTFLVEVHKTTMAAHEDDN